MDARDMSGENALPIHCYGESAGAGDRRLATRGFMPAGALVVWCAALLTSSSFGVDDVPGAPPAAACAAAEIAPPEGLDPVVWDRLGEIERAGVGIRTLTARITMREVNDLTLASTTRTGRLVYRAAGSASDDAPTHPRALAVLFDSRIDGNRRRPQSLHYVFSGRWLVEIDVDQKMFTRYEVAGAGEDFDPMRLGQGPVPLPVGQPRDEVLRRFTVMPGELPDEGPLSRLAGDESVYVLHLEPIAGSQGSMDMRSLLLVYSAVHHLPLGVQVVTPEGDLRTARLDDLTINPELGAEAEASLSVEPPTDREGWRIESRGAAPARE